MIKNNTKLHIEKRTAAILLGIICLGIVVNCFFNLSDGELRDWDEARHGVSAYEMLQHGDFLINTYDDKPDYWNAKPPLSFWTVIVGYKLFGFNPLGLRFFSALFSCLTLFFTLMYCYKKFSIRASCITGLIILSLYTFFERHNARTADPDALFLLFTTSELLIVLAWPMRYRAYHIASLLAGLSFLTKSFHAVPVVFLLFIFFWMDFSLSRQSLKQAVLCLLIALTPVTLWGTARFLIDGTLFFERMIFYDLLKRGTEAIEGHDGNIFYYVKFIIKRYVVWFVIPAAGVALIWRLQCNAHKLRSELLCLDSRTLRKLALTVIVPLLVYSAAATKLWWYIYPIFPFISILLGIFSDRVYSVIALQSKMFAKGFMLCVLAAGLIGEVNTLGKIHRHVSRVNPVHAAMAELGQIPANHKAMLFLDTGDWRPSDMLAARLYGDFQLMPGGTSAYDAAVNTGKTFLLSRIGKKHSTQNSQ